MCTILKTISQPINVITELIYDESDINNLAYKYMDKQGWFFVAPIAWANDDSLPFWETIAQNNTLVAAYDKDLLYPWSLPNVHIAQDDNRSITILDTEGNQTLSITGSSVDCCYKIVEEMQKAQTLS